jgi:drug/metabolite transporter (DMT)-like permease
MEKRASLLLVLSTAVISGISIFLNKYAVKGIDSDIFTLSKNLLVALFLFSVILMVSKFKEIKDLKQRDWANLALIGFIGGSVPFLLYFRGLQMTTAASASLIHKTMFVFVIIFALSFLKEKLNKKAIMAAGLLLIGNYLLLKPTFSFNIGDLLILSATLLWAIENVISKKILTGLSGNIVAFGRMFFGTFFIFVYLLSTGKANLLLSLSNQQISWIFLTAGMLILYVMTWYNGLKHVDVSLATAILLLGAPITASMNYLAGAQVSFSQAAGIFFLLVGILLFMNSTADFSIKGLRRAWSKKTKA